LPPGAGVSIHAATNVTAAAKGMERHRARLMIFRIRAHSYPIAKAAIDDAAGAKTALALLRAADGARIPG
jgi:hypothetical protein